MDPILASLTPSLLALVEGSLSNDEVSSDEEMLAYFIDNGLTEEQARAKLQGAGAPVADTLSGKPLADLFDAVFSAGGTDAPGGAVPPKDAVPTPDAASWEAPADSADTPPKAAPPKAARGKPQ